MQVKVAVELLDLLDLDTEVVVWMFLGGSGGGIGNGGDAGAGGGAIEMISSGKVKIEPGVRVAMNGGTVFVNPTVGANFSGGAGSGGAVRIVANDIENLGIIEVKGGDSSGADPRKQVLNI